MSKKKRKMTLGRAERVRLQTHVALGLYVHEKLHKDAIYNITLQFHADQTRDLSSDSDSKIEECTVSVSEGERGVRVR